MKRNSGYLTANAKQSTGIEKQSIGNNREFDRYTMSNRKFFFSFENEQSSF